jgi:L-lactate dehydrogenase (cytochrome)
MDGGVRSGQDLLKALALGAKGAFIGRAMVYGLGAGGEAGVTRALNIIREETDITMALMGERDIRNIGAHNVYANDLERRQGY